MSGLSFRARILAVVVVLGLAPVLVIGMRLASDAERVAEEVLRTRLAEGLVSDVETLELNWIPVRSRVLDLGDLPEVRAVLQRASEGGGTGATVDFAVLDSAFLALPTGVGRATLRSREGRVLWSGASSGARTSGPSPFGTLLSIPVTLFDPATGEPTGSLIVDVAVAVLEPPGSATALAGATVTAFDEASGALLLPSAFPPELLRADVFDWDGETWVVERRSSIEPVLTLVAAAPLTPFAGAFREASERGGAFLMIMAVVGVGLAYLVTVRLTASLERVSSGAWAVAEGDLDRRVPVEGPDEVRRLATAFNRMTESLRSTLDKLTERESLAAVNEFAAALAHEVRNPLTSLQLDLQEVEEELPEDSPMRRVQAEAIEDLRRLNGIVSGALETARSGHVDPVPMDLWQVLEDVAHRAEPHAAAAGVEIVVEKASDEGLTILGDAAALQRVVLNLVLNGIQASSAGDVVRLAADEAESGVVISVSDEGEGIAAEHLERINDPFFTTRPGGTGLGLPIARRIVTAHGGRLRVRSTAGAGTTISVELPGPALG